ncbi:hypothetical protein Lal_00023122 [Lupinus albus]|nr:hypothetical protein Lal_00023122 [Lupinus albus]
MRLQNHDNAKDITQFSEQILKMGDTKLYDPNDMVVLNTYPNLQHQYKDEQFLQCRAILASTNEIIGQINDYVLSKIPSNEKEYLSLDLVDMSDTNDSGVFNILILEFLNSLETSRLPNHNIKLKVGTLVIFLRNIDQYEGLCNDVDGY